MRVLGKSREQSLVCDDVDPAGQSSGGGREIADSSVVEKIGAVIACSAEPKRDVCAHFLRFQRRERKTVRDTLAQLANLRLAQIVVELRLSKEHDLQQLMLLGLQVGQQPDLL